MLTNALNFVATATPVTVQDGVKESLSALTNITDLITTYPFNVYFGASILFLGIGIFVAVKRAF